MLFGLLVTGSPEEHPWISKEERDHIVATRMKPFGYTAAAKSDGSAEGVGVTVGHADGSAAASSAAAPDFCNVPWSEFFRVKAYWATLIAHFCMNYMSYLALSLGKSRCCGLTTTPRGLGYKLALMPLPEHELHEQRSCLPLIN